MGGVLEEEVRRKDGDNGDQSAPVGTPKSTTHPEGQDTRSKQTAGANASDGISAAPENVDMTVERYARTKEQRRKAKGGKPGHPGRFQGEMLSFLESKRSEYERLPAIGVEGRHSALSTFWDAVIQDGFWVEFSVADARNTMPHESLLDDREVIAYFNSVSNIL